MPKRHHEWVPGEKAPLIEPQSMAKHRVLEEYLRRYVPILTSGHPSSKLSLVIVDGFAGGGEYTNPDDSSPYPGSPFRLRKGVEKGIEEARVSREARGIKTPLEAWVRYYLVEKDPMAFNFLKGTFRRRGLESLIGKDTFLINATFEEFAPKLIEKLHQLSARPIFILDQYGYSDAPFPLIHRLLDVFPRGEVILTLATDWLLDHGRGDASQMRKLLRSAGLAEYLDPEELAQQEMESTQWRAFAQKALAEKAFKASGARFYTPFFFHSPQANRSYWLLHFSNHPTARNAMAELHWSLANHFLHYGRGGLDMLGYDPRKNIDDQFWLAPEFSFDELAAQTTRQQLIEDLPPRIFQLEEEVPFRNLFGELCNETPATWDQLQAAFLELAKGGELKILSSEGRPRDAKRLSRLHPNDRIHKTQLTLFPPRTT